MIPRSAADARVRHELDFCMPRLPALVLLVVLVLPYARAPLCQVGAHEHEGGDMMVHQGGEVVSGSDGDIDCHSDGVPSRLCSVNQAIRG